MLQTMQRSYLAPDAPNLCASLLLLSSVYVDDFLAQVETEGRISSRLMLKSIKQVGLTKLPEHPLRVPVSGC